MSGDHNQYQKPTSKDCLQVEAMKLALEALEYAAEEVYSDGDDDIIGVARRAVRQAIAQADQFPDTTKMMREWVGLTDEEWDCIWDEVDTDMWSQTSRENAERMIEAKLKEKNAYGWQSVENVTEYLDDLRGGADDELKEKNT
jgi:hypothetical protein